MSNILKPCLRTRNANPSFYLLDGVELQRKYLITALTLASKVKSNILKTCLRTLLSFFEGGCLYLAQSLPVVCILARPDDTSSRSLAYRPLHYG